MQRKRPEWFIEVWGYDPTSTPPPIVRFEELVDADVEFLEERPRVVNTRFGRRAVINVRLGSEVRTLFLSRKSLAVNVARLESERGGLRGLRVHVREIGRRGRAVIYDVKALTPVEQKQT